MFCQKCGTENNDSAAYCNRCGSPMKMGEEKPCAEAVRSPAPKKGIAIAVVAIMLVAGCGLAYFYGNLGGNDGPVFKSSDGTYILTDTGSTIYAETSLYKGTLTVTIENGNMDHTMNLDKKTVADDGVTISPTVIKRYTTSSEAHNVPLPPNYTPIDDMKSCFPFLSGFASTAIMCTFSNGSAEVDAYKFVNSDMGRAIYVSTDGVIYQWCERVDNVGMNFILNGWTRTSNGSGYFC